MTLNGLFSAFHLLYYLLALLCPLPLSRLQLPILLPQGLCTCYSLSLTYFSLLMSTRFTPSLT